MVSRVQPQTEAILRPPDSTRPHLRHISLLHEAEPRRPKNRNRSGKEWENIHQRPQIRFDNLRP